jgi:replicative DNA helicase
MIEVKNNALAKKLVNTDKEIELLSMLIGAEKDFQLDVIDQTQSRLFSKTENRELFELVSKTINEGRDINWDSIRTYVSMQPEYRKAALDDALDEIEMTETYDTKENLIYFIKEAYESRCLWNAIEQARVSFQRSEDRKRIVEQLTGSLIDLEVNKKNRTLNDVYNDVMGEIFEGKKKAKGKLTGLSQWDMEYGGIIEDRVYVIGAASGGGKTALAVSLTERMCAMYPNEVAVLYISMEMSDQRIFKRLLSTLTDYTVAKIEDRFGKGFTEAEKENLINESLNIRGWPLEIIYETMSVQDLKTAARRFALKNKGKHLMIFIDHLGEVDGDLSAIRTHTMDCIKAAKSFCVDYNASVFPLVQLKKELDGPTRASTYHRPFKSDILETGSILQKADALILLWRPEYYGFDTISYGNNPEWDCRGRIIMLNEKNRDGQAPTAQIYKCKIATNRFENDPSPFA